jgi:hypothetical protein
MKYINNPNTLVGQDNENVTWTIKENEQLKLKKRFRIRCFRDSILFEHNKHRKDRFAHRKLASNPTLEHAQNNNACARP